MVLIQLLLHRLLHVLMVSSSSVSLLLRRGVEVSNATVSPYGSGFINVQVFDDDNDVVSVTGTTSTHMVITGTTSAHMVIGGIPVHTSTPPSCIVILTMMMQSLSLSNT